MHTNGDGAAAEEEAAEDWRLWCRLCAKHDPSGNISAFLKDEQQPPAAADAGLVLTIEKYFRVQIMRDEALPQRVCTECFSLLTSLVNFAERVQKVQQMFATLQASGSEGEARSALHAVRERFGLLDEEREHVVLQQALPEVHYFEARSKVNDSEIEARRNPLDERVKEEGDPADEEDMEMDMEDVADAEYLLEEEEEEEEEEAAPRKARASRRCKRQASEASSTGSSADVGAARHSSPTAAAFLCTECPRKFKRAQYFRQHMRRTHSKLPPPHELRCARCPRVFPTPHQLEKHAKVHLPLALKKTLPCPYCPKKFTSNALVQTHIKYVHMNERPFICEECGVAVRTNAALKSHMLTHTDYAPFECEACHKRFKNQMRLKNHLETHDPHKHMCAECGLQLNSRATLNRHLLVHSDEMLHKCDYCGRAFKRAKALKNHLILHTGLKPYACDFCERTFANGSNCRSHKKKAHPAELAALEASGGGRAYTRNIPKLEALKAVTKAADNLAPVVSKQSGRFAFGKKPNARSTRHSKAARAVPPSDGASDATAAAAETPAPLIATSPSGVAIPTIDNIYSHMLKQASMAAASAAAATGQRPPSSGATSPCHVLEQGTEASPAPPPEQLPSFYAPHQSLMPQEDLAALRSPDSSQASQLAAEEHSSNASATHFYAHMRENLQGAGHFL